MKEFVPFSGDEEVEAIGVGLIDRTLPRVQWTHAAHFSVALWLMVRRPEVDATVEMPGWIRAYNEATGTANTDTSGYHETITQASLRAARDFLLRRGDEELFVTCNALMASGLGRSDWLMEYWSRDRLFSVEARRGWVEPDVRELPF